jgi:hypothetical protein
MQNWMVILIRNRFSSRELCSGYGTDPAFLSGALGSDPAFPGSARLKSLEEPGYLTL